MDTNSLDVVAGAENPVARLAKAVLIDLVLFALCLGGPGLVADVALVLEVVLTLHVLEPGVC